jgi:hypothetical protein
MHPTFNDILPLILSFCNDDSLFLFAWVSRYTRQLVLRTPLVLLTSLASRL